MSPATGSIMHNDGKGFTELRTFGSLEPVFAPWTPEKHHFTVSLYSATENQHSFIVLTLGASWSKETMLSSDSILPLRVEDCNQMYASKKYCN